MYFFVAVVLLCGLIDANSPETLREEDHTRFRKKLLKIIKKKA